MKYSTQFKTALLSSVFMLPAVSAADEVSDLFTAFSAITDAILQRIAALSAIFHIRLCHSLVI